ncbi:M99 family carboxypeptidase catalytic domain-containing protein [Helicobacter anatolicus]|uniref:M99 family carboxypeptidase catalytic domain-containing protein n=1 Tax=Helicobacter anatolicus TaxID=2905874 RepID=UPI001E34FC02|nr:M99 family carboxypeptidase catalytic domain-containing protein [Helicobacter anatolicus]MCE3038408.1 purine-nucleoside phosphorylase [Helicobacter anatolicus]
MKSTLFFLTLLFFFNFLNAKQPNKNFVLDFDVVKKETHTSPTLLLIGGIQGDEPGGFNATNIFLMHYKILTGNVWVVPVLNKHSMLHNHRGIYGDMNRKFDTLKKDDPEYKIIQEIKTLITNPQVDAILHLHDGSGFYNPTYINNITNPNRWGACCIVDQNFLEESRFPELGKIADNMIIYINKHILKPEHKYHKRNTKTAKGDVEMEKALTYFAIKNKKTAIANEASKNLSLEERVYYHLLALEGLMHQLGIKFERNFNLTPNKLYYLINNTDLTLKIENLITLPLYGLRENINFFPLPQKDLYQLKSESKAHIVSFLKKDKQIVLKYGNKAMTKIRPEYMDFDYSIQSAQVKVDGITKEFAMGSIVDVKKSFEIIGSKEYRVNIIGYIIPNDKSLKPNETDINISLKDCISKFSLDKKGKIYRAEFYKGEKFSGMLLLRFL